MSKRPSVLFCLLAFFYIFHLINLTLLPFFNDESIYLDWGVSAIHIPGHMYDSLLDAKQPLMVWIFGVVTSVIPEPLFAGRLVSVLAGSLTAVGLYVVSKRLFNKRVAIISAVLYSVIPIFVFYNRQALMEAAIACVGIWSFDALLNALEKPTRKNNLILGVIWGIGFLIKSSILLFIIPSIFIIIYQVIKKRNFKLAKSSLFLIGSFLCTTYIVLIQPYFWQSLNTNSRYTYTVTELLAFPIKDWIIHFLGFAEIGLIFMTPLVFLVSFFGLYKMKQNKTGHFTLFCSYFISALLLESVLGKSQNQRYLVPFLPFLIIPTAYVLSNWWQENILKKVIVVFTFLTPTVLSLFLLFSPQSYISQLSKITKYSDLVHAKGQTSGYGIKESVAYIKGHSDPSQPTMVLFALNAGNPESAIDLHTQLEPNLYGMYIDASVFPELEKYQCMSSVYPVFFVTRSEQQANLNPFFEQEKKFPNPDEDYFIGIYSLKKNCTGETLSLSDFYQPVIDRMSVHK